jgi:four helix bundle protein
LKIADFRLQNVIMNPTELKNRTKQFALRILKLVAALPNTIEGRAIANQLVRCGTSVAANYRATCRARSRAEFVAKIGVVLEEADETLLWLELIHEAKLLPTNRVQPLLSETNELVAIMVSSRKSASSNLKSTT